LCEGGELFVLDMGEPIRIQDLAVQMIEMRGFRPNQDIKIEFSGLRPGEKLYEEAIHQAEDIKTTSHPKIKCLISYNQNSALLDDIKTLRERLNQVPSTTLRDWLKEKVPEYKTTV
jgi:FlaA1/EpsC-like NDP-sugar epimerase